MPTPPDLRLIEPLSWPAQRWLYCRRAMRQRARRWAVWVGIALLLANVGSSDPVATTLGLIGLLVMPLFAASQVGVVAWLGATLAYGVLIVLLLRALQPVLWCGAWGPAVHALPVPEAALQRSDTQVLLVALAPLAVLLGGGWCVWASHVQGLRLPAAAGLAGALGFGFAGGRGLLRGWRRSASAPQPRPGPLPRSLGLLPQQAAWHALLWTPLWRGPAQRLGRWAAGGVLLLCGLGSAALWLWPPQLPWTLAALSAAGLVWLSRTNALSAEELGPLLALAAAHLPLPVRRLARWQQVQVLLPALGVISLLSAMAAIAAPSGLLRPTVLWLWGLVQAFVYLLEVAWPPVQPSDQSARWWFFLVVLLALSSEVLT